MAQFYGYERPDGTVGVRNHLLVLSTMDCSYEPAKKIAEQVEGAVAITQTYGCRDHAMLVHNLAGTALNPNVAGVLIVGLGCETLTGDILMERIEPSGKPVYNITIQELGGTIKTHAKGVRILQKMKQDIAEQKRESFPMSMLTLAVECGGSDATSGLAANPAVGAAADLLIEEGGTVMFGETQEMCGTQHLLADRAVDKKTSDAIYDIIETQMARQKAMGVSSRWMSKGNIDGGLRLVERAILTVRAQRAIEVNRVPRSHLEPPRRYRSRRSAPQVSPRCRTSRGPSPSCDPSCPDPPGRGGRPRSPSSRRCESST